MSSGAPQVSILGLLFNILVSDMDSRLECTLSTFPADTTMLCSWHTGGKGCQPEGYGQA